MVNKILMQSHQNRKAYDFPMKMQQIEVDGLRKWCAANEILHIYHLRQEKYSWILRFSMEKKSASISCFYAEP